MRISFSPYAALPGSDDIVTASVDGDVLTVNGDTINFAVLGPGDRIADAHSLHRYLAGPIERIDGVIHLTLKLPYAGVGGHVEEPPEVTVTTGSVLIPTITEGA